MSGDWTTADYALIVSLCSAGVAGVALLWNVWQKYIFVKPALQVTFGIYQVFERAPGSDLAMRSGHQLLHLVATNMGPGPVILDACVTKSKADRWKRGHFSILNPIHGDPTNKQPVSIGPFSGGLPAKIDAGEMKSFFFPYEKDCLLKEPRLRVGICDTYGRNNWYRRRDVRRAAATYRKDFGSQGVP